jgi:sRNA-binding regulator protein Hfq
VKAMQENYHLADIEMTTINEESSPIVNIMEEFLGPDETAIEAQEKENKYFKINSKDVQKIVTVILEDFIREISSEHNMSRTMANRVPEQEIESGIQATLCFLDSSLHMTTEEDNGQIFDVVEDFLNSSGFGTFVSGLEILSTEESFNSEEIMLENNVNRDEVFKHFVSQIISNIATQSSVKNDNHSDLLNASYKNEEENDC